MAVKAISHMERAELNGMLAAAALKRDELNSLRDEVEDLLGNKKLTPEDRATILRAVNVGCGGTTSELLASLGIEG